MEGLLTTGLPHLVPSHSLLVSGHLEEVDRHRGHGDQQVCTWVGSAQGYSRAKWGDRAYTKVLDTILPNCCFSKAKILFTNAVSTLS